MTTVYALDDPLSHWGQHLVAAVRQRGGKARLFRSAAEVPDVPGTVAFMHLYHRPRSERTLHKAIAAELARTKHVRMIPSAKECVLYDDKVAQYAELAKWMPRTWHLTTRDAAERALEQVSFPLISKAAEGAGSSNVRKLDTKNDAEREIEAVFGGVGLKLCRPPRQNGYLLWQDFLAGNDGDWRVNVLAGRYGFVFRRQNKPGTVFASGSGKFVSCTKPTDEVVRALDFVLDIVRQREMNFVAADLVVDFASNHLRLLEVSTGWKRASSQRVHASERVMFRRSSTGWLPTNHTDGTLFELLAELLLTNQWKS